MKHVIKCDADIKDLMHEVYRRAYVSAKDEPLTSPTGKKHNWQLDLRVPLMDHDILRVVVQKFLDILERQCVKQVVGRGFGSYPLVGGILALGEHMRGGLVRETPKRYGRCRLVEGCLNQESPMFMVDDLANSKRSLLRTLKELSEFNVTGCLVVFNFLDIVPQRKLPPRIILYELATLERK